MNSAARPGPKGAKRLVNLGLGLSVLLLAACTTAGRPQTPAPGGKEGAVKDSPPAYAPKAGDSRLARGRVMIEQTALMNGVLRIAGNLPTPCHEVRIRMPEAADGAEILAVEAWSVYDAGKMCAQMLQPFSIQVPLPAAVANARVTVNGQPAGLAAR